MWTVAASPAEVKARIEQIRKEIEASDSDWDKEKLNERLAKLSGGIAVIKVGAATEVEMKERKHRIEDAISATKAAVEEGVIPGGGATLTQIASTLDDGLGLTGDEATGVVDRAQGARRAAAVDRPERRPRRLRRGGQGARAAKFGTGLNAATGEYVDLAKAGIVDPVKVTRSAVANAASIAGLLLTTESLIVEKPKAPEPAQRWPRPRPRSPARPGLLARRRQDPVEHDVAVPRSRRS